MHAYLKSEKHDEEQICLELDLSGLMFLLPGQAKGLTAWYQHKRKKTQPCHVFPLNTAPNRAFCACLLCQNYCSSLAFSSFIIFIYYYYYSWKRDEGSVCLPEEMVRLKSHGEASWRCANFFCHGEHIVLWLAIGFYCHVKT